MNDVPSPHVHVPCPHCGRVNRVDLGRIGGRPKCGACGRPILLDRPIKLSDDDFDRVISGSDVAVLVDFHADWCQPCKAMAPVLDELADEHAGEVLVAKLDTDRNRRVAGRFAIRAIPTVIVFAGGREVARETGAVGKARLESLVTAARAALPTAARS